MPTIPVMSDITDLFANIGNNFDRLRFVIALLFGILFAFFVARKVMKFFKGGE